MDKVKKFLWKLNNKRKRILRYIAARIIVSQAIPEMDKFGWNTLRWIKPTNGVFLVYYVCKDFQTTYNVPFGDNSVKINGKGDPRCNGCQEATELSRHSGFSIAEDIQTVQHPSPDENHDRHDRTAQDQDCCSPHSQTGRYPSQC